MITISKERYRDLLQAEAKLCALECAGVDNWEGYDMAMSCYFEEDSEDSAEVYIFKKGDRVVFTNKGSSWNALNGIIGTVVNGSDQTSIIVEFDDFEYGWGQYKNSLFVMNNELTLIEGEEN